MRPIGTYFVTLSTLGLAALFATATTTPSEAGGNCPYGGDYIACLQAGETVDYCKAYVLNCQDTSGDMTEDPEPCDWLLDTKIGKVCPAGYVRVGFPIDVISNDANCPYDSYVDCLLAGRTVNWCKSHQLNCSEVETATVVVPIEAECGLLGIDGTIEYEGTPELIGGNYCLHVTSYTYTGGQRSIVDAQIDKALAEPNPDCGGDTNCVCMPASCL